MEPATAATVSSRSPSHANITQALREDQFNTAPMRPFPQPPRPCCPHCFIEYFTTRCAGCKRELFPSNQGVCRLCGSKDLGYLCNHCDRDWSDKRETEIKGKDELYVGKPDDVKLSIRLRAAEEEEAQVQEARVQESQGQEAPIGQQAQGQEIPVQQGPFQNSPAQESSIQEAPVDHLAQVEEAHGHPSA